MDSVIRPIKRIYQFFVDHPYRKSEILADRYLITDFLGLGSFGLVYRCADLQTANEVAVKQLRKSKRKNKKEIHFFLDEIEILQSLQHPLIPKYYSQFTYDDNLFFTMELIKGENLEDLLFERKKQFSERESVQIIKKLLEVVDYMHSQEVYHGDLRIPNIILRNDEPVLIDFGLAYRPNQSSVKDTARIKNRSKVSTLVLQQEDYFDLGDILLFLLYSTYPQKNKKALPWTEELSLLDSTDHLLRRLLGLDEKYTNADEIKNDIHAVLLESNNLTRG